MKNTEKRYMTMKEAMEYTGMGELTLLGILSDIDVYPVQHPERQGTSYTTHTKRTAPVLMECVGCGKEYEGHSKLCPSCRKKYTEQIKQQHDYWTCPICGGSVQFSYWKRREDIKAKTICCSTRC